MHPSQHKNFYINLKQYDIVITTSFMYKHGISGHVFEMFEYYYAIKKYTNLKPCMLVADGTTQEEFCNSIDRKYIDCADFQEDLFVHPAPSLLFANKILFVDGSFRGLDKSEIFADHVYLFRCKEEDFSYFSNNFKKVTLLQDFRVYDPAENVELIDYNKKILFSNLKAEVANPNKAMFYMTSTCRAIPDDDIKTIAQKNGFDDYVVLTNTPEQYTNALEVPVPNLWTLFSTYIYTAIPMKWDCSSRFVMECKYFGKEVIFEVDYYDKALEVRKKDSVENVELKEDDLFIRLLNA